MKKSVLSARAGIAGASAFALVALGVSFGATGAVAEPIDPTFAANSGTIDIETDFDPGFLIEVTSEVPGLEDQYNTATAVTDDEGVASFQNFAGPVTVDFVGYPTRSSGGSDPIPSDSPDSSASDTESNSNIVAFSAPEPATAAIWRGKEVTFEYTGGQLQLVGEAPTVAAPDSEELDTLVPIAVYSFSPSTYIAGTPFDLSFSGITNITTGEVIDGIDVSNYGYSAPTLIGTSSITAGSFAFTVPAAFTTDPHTLVSFDSFGRVITGIELDGGVTAPPVTTPAVDTAPPAPVLANTGSADAVPFGLIALGTLVLGGMAFAITGVLRRREASVD
ncbi:hypothetical protein [Agreia bicolorata]|uniref:LPXTG-motif cell wall anchor domain-containing protein n=1 Tax=Agreia bicolorata TaxID=110935 RepID=A0ABR5CHH9_9MICO|nr:hypothetical protein [Agreia bicolorata]KJC65035.1 hypothetical protein TZ00_05510 [Agreia bicolorata]